MPEKSSIAREITEISDDKNKHFLKRDAIRGSGWTLFGFGASQIVRLGGNITLAAMLFQEAFALMAIVGAVIQGLAMFSDVGLGSSVVQNKRGDDPRFLDTVWTIQVIRGLIIAILAALLAYPVAIFYATNDPMAHELRWLIPIVALGMAIEGFQSMKLKLAWRHINLRRITFIELFCTIISTACMIIIASLTRSVYALAIGGLISMALQCILSYVAVPGRTSRFTLDKSAVREIINFGKWIFLATTITFFALQLDKLLFARFFSLDQVGVYAIAANLAMLTPLLMGRVQSAVAFPLYSRMLDQKVDLEEAVNFTKLPMLALGGYLVALSIACAESFISLAYDARYVAASTYVQILAAGAWFAIIDGIYGAALLASGRAQWVAAVNATKITSFCILMVIGFYAAGFIGAVIAVAASDAIKLAVGLAGAKKIGLHRRTTDIIFTVYTAVVAGGVLFLNHQVLNNINISNISMLIIQFAVVTVLFLPPTIIAFNAIRSRELHT